jgi:hypothetical protein
MIKFFRKIRQNMIKENKISKYMLYAIGEILLVVLGILIALQINNWNENKKTHKSERIYLSQMLNSLKSDLGRTIYIYENRALIKDRAIKTLINDLNKVNLPHDSILRPSFRQMTMTLSFAYDKGAYESLKSHGLGIIQNDSLRQKIVRVYENDLPLGIVFIDNNRNLQSELRQKYLLELTEYDYKKTDSLQWEVDTNVDFLKIKDSKPLRNLFRLETSVASNYIRRLQENIADFENLIEAIENEFDKTK